MQSILIIGEENRAQNLKKQLEKSSFSVEVSDGDEEEDFKEFDIIIDVNFDDDSENFPIYANLRDKLIFLSTVKQSLSESAYVYPTKVRSKLFGLNCLDHYLNQDTWEISYFRGNELSVAESFLQSLNKKFIVVEDRVGMYRPRTEFLCLNEKVKLLEEGSLPNALQNPILEKEFAEIDQIGISDVFETLIAIYEDTKEIKYQPTPLLKKKYLRNHNFVK
jgi:hypothetical protein